jgi:predicted lipoprotein with Yx(FWY)xxD motif
LDVIAKTLVLALAVGLTVAGGAVAPADGSVGSSSATLTVRSSSYGTILFDGRGRALYAFTRDRRGGPSRCYGACAQAWPVYFAPGRLVAGRGIKQSLIGTTRRRDGRRQVTYDGRPLYYYVGDGVGQVKCQAVDEFGGTWLVVRPSGRLVR